MCTLYVAADAAPPGLGRGAVVAVPVLLQRLLHVLAAADPSRLPTRHRAIEALVLIEIAELERLPLHLALPEDARLLRFCARVLDEPDGGRPLDDLAADAGLSLCTLRRLFQQQLGMNFSAWRQQARLVEAMARLADREPVAKVAREQSVTSA